MGTLIFAVGVLDRRVQCRQRPATGPAVIPTAPSDPTAARLRRAVADAAPRPFWLDQPGAPATAVPLAGPRTADLAVIGGGFSGLWTALLAKERDPARDVVLLEGRHHRLGRVRAQRRLLRGEPHPRPRQRAAPLPRRDRQRCERLGPGQPRRDRGERSTGTASTATSSAPASSPWRPRPWQLRELAAYARRRPPRTAGRYDLLDRAAVRAEVELTDLPGRRVGPRRLRHGRPGPAGLGPAARPACGWACASTSTPRSRRIEPVDGRLRAAHRARPAGRRPGRAGHRGARPALLRRLRHYVVPVYDYALMTEPLSAEQLAADRLGATGRASATRPTSSTTTGSPPTTGSCGAATTPSTTTAAGSAPDRDQRDADLRRLAQHFYETFPQLAGLRFTHKWGGVIDTCSRFCAFFGRAYGGRLAYAVGYTGLGVGATRFGANVMLDLLAGEQTELTGCRWCAAGRCRSRPSRCAPGRSS